MAQIWNCRLKFFKMKKLISATFGIIALLFLANCTTQSTIPENIKRYWMLVEFQDFNKDVMVTNKAHLNLAIKNEMPGKFSANMGCNSMFGTATFGTSGSVKFSAVGSTMMYCEQNMDLEKAFIENLPKMTRYKVEGQFLTLSAPSGEQMKFAAADWD